MGEVLDWVQGNAIEVSAFSGFLGIVLLLFIRARRASRSALEHATQGRVLEKRLQAIESAGDGIFLTAGGERCIYANQAAAALFGHEAPAEMFGKSWRSLFEKSEAEVVQAQVLPALRSSGRWVGSLRGKQGGGTRIPLDVSLTQVEGGYVWVVRSRQEKVGMNGADPLVFESLVRRAGTPLVLLGPDRRVVEWNPEAERLLGQNRGRVLGTDFLAQFPQDDQERVAGELRGVVDSKERVSFEAPVLSDPRRVLLWSVTPGSGDGDGQLVCVAQDASWVKEAERELLRQESLYRLLANNSSDLVGLHDLEGTFTYVSPSCTTLLGYQPDDLAGKDPYQLSHTDDWMDVQASLASARFGRLNRTQLRFRSHEGQYVWFEMLVRPIFDNHGTVVQLQTSSRDISERKAFEDQLAHQALHEPLTGLPNRSLFMDRLQHALIRGKRTGGKVAVMFMDLDRFKIINDSMGHEAGDRLIAAVARRVRAVLRDSDTVARLGGDEFGFLLEHNISESDAETVAGRVLKELEPPFTFSGQEMYISASLGIAFDSPDIEGPEDLLRYADVAMYRAKGEGPGNFRIFDPAVDSGATGRLAMETDLRLAIERKQLFALYQPIVSLTTGKISGVEALVRWQHPDRGLVGPDEFIPVAEETGLIVPIGYFIARQACEALKSWQSAVTDGRELVVAVNLSTRQFEQPDLAKEIQGIVQQTETPSHCLRLEITESELMRDMGRISELKELGLQVAIDDFGTGYSSLGYLKNIQADSLKIDKSFVSGLGENIQDEAIVRTVVTLAGSLNLDVTAEGIETAEQLQLLREIGCGSGQGYFFAKPQSSEDLLALVQEDPTW
jgi:diguanylate cyclase (GGDEF)-like protein/PAS domain S-box-containing protein